jgi:hypothetical protein
MKTGIILVRVSSRRQLDGTSPATQEADCRGCRGDPLPVAIRCPGRDVRLAAGRL